MCPPTSEKTVGRLELSPCCIAIVLFHAVATGSERTGSFLVSDMHFFPLATVLSLPTPVCVCCDLTSLPLQRPAPSGRASDSTRWGEKGGIVVRPSCRVRSWALPRTLLTTVQCGAARRGGERERNMVYLAAIGPHELDVPVDLQSPKPAHIAGHAPRTVHSTISMKIGLLPLHRRDGPSLFRRPPARNRLKVQRRTRHRTPARCTKKGC